MHKIQSTGGVSIFTLLICLASGIHPIITSSSDKKVNAIRKLDSRIQGINYKKCLKITEEV